MSNESSYIRYHIDTKAAPDIKKWPSRFRVKVGKIGLAKYLLSEIRKYGWQSWKRKDVILSRPCLYGVFSGPIGGFAPQPEHCVGCLRCTTENPEFISVTHNPERKKLGDSFFTSDYINALSYESNEGLIPVRGAGYRGKFGGEGWDGMWTDMSEIVRPTRDGIHGREFISTVVDIGFRPNYLEFDDQSQPIGKQPKVVSIPLPLIFDTLPEVSPRNLLTQIVTQAADSLQTLVVVPIKSIIELDMAGNHIIPLVRPEEIDLLPQLAFDPELIELDGWHPSLFKSLSKHFPDALLILRIPFPNQEDLLSYVNQGIHTFHLLADFHGKNTEGTFILDMIRKTHQILIGAGIRQEVTLLGSGGIIAAEHIPKAILCGLDAVALDTPILAALQADFDGECRDRDESKFNLPQNLSLDWGVQRILNLTAAWRDQLLEISGAMGIREIRRMRGEMGRAMFMKTLEAEAFSGVAGYER